MNFAAGVATKSEGESRPPHDGASVMTRAILAISGSVPFAGLRNFLGTFWQQISGDAYRPELHYMRGPGPAWHAKHGQVPTL